MGSLRTTTRVARTAHKLINLLKINVLKKKGYEGSGRQGGETKVRSEQEETQTGFGQNSSNPQKNAGSLWGVRGWGEPPSRRLCPEALQSWQESKCKGRGVDSITGTQAEGQTPRAVQSHL